MEMNEASKDFKLQTLGNINRSEVSSRAESSNRGTIINEGLKLGVSIG